MTRIVDRKPGKIMAWYDDDWIYQSSSETNAKFINKISNLLSESLR